MGKLAGVAAFIAASLLFFSAGASAQGYISGPFLPKDPVKGRLLFVNKGCVKCHAVLGRGGTEGPDLGKVELNKSLLEIASIMWNHSPRMTEKFKELKLPRPNFKEEEMADLVAFLYYLNYFSPEGNAAAGKKAFDENRCVRCHSVGGEGGNIGPSLDDFRKFVSPAFMANAMWNHGPKMTQTMVDLGIERPKLMGNDVADILAYINQESSLEVADKIYLKPGNPRDGSRLFIEKHCIQCHIAQGEGGTIGPELAKRELRKSLAQIAGTLWNHGSVMWDKMERFGIEVPKFSAQEMADLISYLYFLQYFDRPGDPKVGQRLFDEKGCSNCHGLGTNGSKAGPDLTKSAVIASQIGVITALWNHVAAMEDVMRKAEISWPKFEGRDMSNLVEYIKEKASEIKR